MEEKKKPIGRWSARCDACWGCGTDESPHYSLGLCRPCYGARRREQPQNRATPPKKRWCIYCDACRGCRRTDISHAEQGYCRPCNERTEHRREAYARYRQTEGSRNAKKRWLDRNRSVTSQMDRFRVRRNRARSYGVEDIFYPWEEALVLAEFSEHCAACGSSEKVALDHHLPLQDGYPLRNNAVPLCLACNSSKGTKRPEAFYSPERLSQIEFHLAWLRVQVLLHQHVEQTP